MSIFKQFIKSLYSPNDIAKYRYQKIGKTILYVFFLMFISVIPFVYHFGVLTLEIVNEGREVVEEELPPFYIRNGELTSDLQEPLTIRKEKITFIFDSTGTMTKEAAERKTNVIALLKNELVVTSTGANTQSFSYTTIGEMSNETIVSFFDSAKGAIWIIIPIIFIVFYTLVSGIGFLKITIFSYLALLLAKLFSKQLVYRHAWRITAYCMTLSTVFFMIMEFMQIVFPFHLYLDWFIITIMMYLSIREIPSPKVKR
ncbi:DUF1189 domain-containing protein [Bacillus chungangensis]|uniref:DUF1189 domain-containing protein n=1 Tax=Bacillus chungangensis TaxID=587633 RepID=A0ABT9WPN1_9BACI|nr:DUF1189 domain-containing protein [Bacillus chungangensis]MDQ0175199.1 hypothetical protein [Bacillus chungangensis]